MSYTPQEIKARAIAFSREHADWADEKSQAQSFWYEFLAIWGIPASKVAVFEQRAQTIRDTVGFIDLFWPGQLLVEHKSRGVDLDKAYMQALDYTYKLKKHEMPRYIVLCDFDIFRIYGLEDKTKHEFKLEDLHAHTHLFDFVTGHEKRVWKDEDPVNILAAERMGALHDALKESGFTGKTLDVFLVRCMFLMFADDTGIFPKDHLAFYLEAKTAEDGSDFGPRLAQVFQVLDTPQESRQKTLDADLLTFPYVNGELFREVLNFPAFDKKMRELFLECCRFDWSPISPAIFGSLFQSVMDAKARRNLGAHYTSEKNILKTVHGLFLDELRADFDRAKNDEKALRGMLAKIANTRLLDPACGCGNFLILSYRELRRLEIDIHKELKRFSKPKDIFEKDETNAGGIAAHRGITVDHLYGIEIEEFPAQIARVALWIMDHLMNVEMAQVLGDYQPSVPLKTSPHIVHGNALRTDWREVVKPEELTYILGNPPFIGKHLMTEEQSADMEFVFNGKLKTFGTLDFVTAWYVKAADFLVENNSILCAFVSTNSITQGEQPGLLWSYLFSVGVKIFFAHRTFKWTNEARGNAAVFCVIIGLCIGDRIGKQLYDYQDPKGEPVRKIAVNISPYLIDQKDMVLLNRHDPICKVPPMLYGNKPVDDGNLILQSEEEVNEYISKEPQGQKYIRKMVSAQEFLHGALRHCFWLTEIQPHELRDLPLLHERIQKVKAFREASSKAPTRETASTPTLFAEIRQPEYSYVLVPMHTSENRDYVPFGFFGADVIVHNSCTAIPEATIFHFGVVSSIMHMTWMRQVCGRIKSDYRYSNNLVYNNFPWPEAPAAEQKAAVEEAAQGVLSARAQFPDSSLADLYDPVTMPPVLTKAHRALDAAVDRCYRKAKFGSELERVEFLFTLWVKYTAGEKAK